jgi:hypothetical protein
VIAVSDGQGKLATLELNVHGPEWTYASQSDATAQVQTEDDGTRTFTGKLTVPNTTEGALSFREAVDPREGGAKATYELTFDRPMTVNGLQVSLLLPADRFGGKMLTVEPAEGAATRILLPRVLDAAKWQLGTVKGKKVEIQIDGENAFALTADETTNLIIHDLRRWEREEFEIRAEIFAEQEGKIVGTDTSFSLGLELSNLGAVTVTGP